MNDINEKSFKSTSCIIREEGLRNARLMAKHPTLAERQLLSLLTDNHIRFKFQKVFYRFIKGYRKYIDAYYIANFWIPGKKLILNVVGSRVLHLREDLRTFSYDDITPRAQVMDLQDEDVLNPEFMKDLMQILQ